MPRTVVCGRCGFEKRHRARGLCDACYVKVRRNKIEYRYDTVRPHKWSETHLTLLKALRTSGLSVRECAPHFPERSYWGVRLCCVKRAYYRGGDAGEEARLDRRVEKNRTTMPSTKRGPKTAGSVTSPCTG